MSERLTEGEIARMREYIEWHPPQVPPPSGMPEWDVRRIVATLEQLRADLRDLRTVCHAQEAENAALARDAALLREWRTATRGLEEAHRELDEGIRAHFAAGGSAELSEGDRRPALAAACGRAFERLNLAEAAMMEEVDA